MSDYDPWQELQRLDHLRVLEAELPDRLRGFIDFGTSTITLSTRLGPVEKRCTLAHELVHAERGPVLVRHTAREEATVAAIAARRLVGLDALIAALRWAGDPETAGEELGVDARTVRDRLRALTDAEREAVRQALEPAASVIGA